MGDYVEEMSLFLYVIMILKEKNCHKSQCLINVVIDEATIQMLQINGNSMKNVSLEEARDAIGGLESTQSLRITIFRDIDPIKLFTSLEGEYFYFVTCYH